MAEDLTLPASILKAQKLLRDAAEDCGVQISGGLGTDSEIALSELFVNLTLLTKSEVGTLFKSESFFSSESERARQLAAIRVAQDGTPSKTRGVELSEIFPDSSSDSAKDQAGASEVVDAECGLLARAASDVSSAGAKKKNVLAFGSAGSGKSTIFLLMLEYLWATRSLWKEKIDLVLAVELRHAKVRAATSLSELLERRFANLNMKKDELLEMESYFCRHPSRLCVVLDGMDECSLQECSEYMQAMLLRRNNVEMHVVVTSRPCADAYRLSQCGKYHQQLEVVGFSQENVKTYVRKVVGGKQAEEMLEKLHAQPDMLALMGTPLFAALACELYCCGRGLAKSSTALYESLLLRVLERNAGKLYKSFAEADAQELELLNEVSRFALAMLSVQKAVFSESEMKSAGLSDAALQLGLLIAYKDGSSTENRQYRFAHLSLQEFMSAWYLSREVLKDEHDAAWLVKRVGHYSGHMTMFWRFVITLLPRKASFVTMEHLWHLICGQRIASTSDAADSRLVADIVSYSHPKSARPGLERMQTMLCASLTYEKMKELADKLLEETCGEGNGCQRVESALPRGRELTDELFLSTLIDVWKKEAVDADTEVFLAAVRNVNPVVASQCERMMLPRPNVSIPSSTEDGIATDMPEVRPAESEKEERYLVHLLVAHHEHCQYQGASDQGAFCDGHCSFFSQVFSKGIRFWSTQLSLFDCVSIGHFLKTHVCFDSSAFHIANSGCGSAGLQSIAAGLSHCTSVRMLTLAKNGCVDGCVLSSIILSLSGSLEIVNLGYNVLSADGLVSVCRALSSCSKLREADVCYPAFLRSQDVPLSCVSEVFESCPNLHRLDLEGCSFQCDDDCVERFVGAVQSHAVLEILGVTRHYQNARFLSRLDQLVWDPTCTLTTILNTRIVAVAD
ncbi:NACHT, LRR and PYD domains-containing protein 3-like [Sycon ciliatum]|uniref:NACHT, LRR and PYD domains-containing protein 3-like n=1 Tax=Sycon ciliatum TaxID=27933 RepID=UPI0031F692EC